MAQPLVFYSNAICPFAHRVWLTLLEMGVEFEFKDVSLATIPDWYKPIYKSALGADPTNDEGAVPVIRDGDFVLAESSVIARYIGDKLAAGPLSAASFTAVVASSGFGMMVGSVARSCAATPVTAGVAMLVPCIFWCFPVSTMVWVCVAERDSGETIHMPGATTSGFTRPSRVGPRELNFAMDRKLDHAGASLSGVPSSFFTRTRLVPAPTPRTASDVAMSLMVPR